MAWQPLGERMITDEAEVRLGIGCGATESGVWGGAKIDNLNVCP